MKREVTITIAGQSLTIRTDESERYLKQLAEFVDGHMRELTRGQRGTSTLNVAILAALNIADEYHKIRRDQEEVNDTLDTLAGRLEEGLAGATG